MSLNTNWFHWAPLMVVALVSCTGGGPGPSELPMPAEVQKLIVAPPEPPAQPAPAPSPPRPQEHTEAPAAPPVTPASIEACGDCRDEIIRAYQAAGRTFQCADFTKSRGGEFFAYAQLQGQGSCEWSLIRDPLVVDQSTGYGLNVLRRAYGESLHINSAYRDPVQNQKVGGAPRSQHLFGDAADIRNEAAFAKKTASREAYEREWAQFLKSGNLEDRCLDLAEQPGHTLSKPCAEWLRMKDAAEKANATYIEPLNLPCRLDCLHADWRAKPGGYR
jgi:hypothetical protein